MYAVDGHNALSASLKNTTTLFRSAKRFGVKHLPPNVRDRTIAKPQLSKTDTWSPWCCQRTKQPSNCFKLFEGKRNRYTWA